MYLLLEYQLFGVTQMEKVLKVIMSVTEIIKILQQNLKKEFAKEGGDPEFVAQATGDLIKIKQYTSSMLVQIFVMVNDLKFTQNLKFYKFPNGSRGPPQPQSNHYIF